MSSPNELDPVRQQLGELESRAAAPGMTEDRFRTLVEEMPGLVDAFDRQMRLVYWNRECERVTGYAAAEVLGRQDIFELLYPDPAYRQQMLDDWQRNPGRYQGEWTLRAKDGTPRIIAWRNVGTLIPLPGWAIWAIGLDVTQQRQAERRLQESEQRLRLALAAGRAGAWQWDQDTGQVHWSEEMFALLETTPAETTPGCAAWDALVHPEDRERVFQQYAASLEHTSDRDLEHRLVLRNGKVLWIRDVGRFVSREPGKRCLHGLTIDITDQVRERAERRRLDDRLREAQKLESLGVLAGGIAHEFNNMLTTMLGYANLGAGETPRGSPLHIYFKEIETSARRAAELCAQMLAYAGKTQIVPQSLDLSALVRNAASLLRVSAAPKANLHHDLDPALPPIQADPAQIQQVVLNLVMNAAEALGETGGEVRVRTATAQLTGEQLALLHPQDALQPGAHVMLEVHDSGCGMDTRTHARIFEPFFTTKGLGRGMGLPAVLGIVRTHGGAVQVDSTPGHGSRFRLYFPPAARATVPTPAPSRGKVLVADDEDGVREYARMLLTSLGLSVVTASDGHEAIAQVEQHRSELRFILLDLTMPNCDGIEALDGIQRLAPNVPILLMSGYSAQDIGARLADRSVAGFLHKPFTRLQLFPLVERLLAET